MALELSGAVKMVAPQCCHRRVACDRQQVAVLDTLLHNLTVAVCLVLTTTAILRVLHALERRVGRHIARHLGWRGVYVTGWIGVSLHELSHLFAVRLFGHRVVHYSLFDPDPVTGTLGYVRHAFRRRNLWQVGGNFFIGIAPFVAGAFCLVGLLLWMLPSAARATLLERGLSLLSAPGVVGAQQAVDYSVELTIGIWRGRTAWLPLQLYLAVCVASHMAPSRPDLGGGLSGGIIAAALGAAAVTTLTWQALNPAVLLAVLVPLGSLALLAVLVQLLYASVVTLVASR